MTRRQLKAINGQRRRFTAVLARRGEKRTYTGGVAATVLLTDLRDAASNELVSDHLWFTEGNWSRGLPDGAAIAFDARVSLYHKGYHGYRDDYDLPPPAVDYHLVRPTQVCIRNPEGHWVPHHGKAKPPVGPAYRPAKKIDPPATASQQAYLTALQKAAGQEPSVEALTKLQAAAAIDALVKAGITPPRNPCQGLTRQGRRCADTVIPPADYCYRHVSQKPPVNS